MPRRNHPRGPRPRPPALFGFTPDGHTTPEETPIQDDPIHRRCPTCGAHPGIRCTTRGRYPRPLTHGTGHHPSRHQPSTPDQG